MPHINDPLNGETIRIKVNGSIP